MPNDIALSYFNFKKKFALFKSVKNKKFDFNFIKYKS